MLSDEGWIQRSLDQPGRWVLSVKIVEVDHEMGRELGLREIGRPVVQELVDATGEAVHVSVLDGFDVVMIDQLESTQLLRIYWAIGTRSRAYAAASGKAILSALPDEERRRHIPDPLEAMTASTITSPEQLDRELATIARRGYAVQRGEVRDDVASVAAPVLGPAGRPVASLSMFTPVQRFPADGEERLGGLVVEAAAKVSTGLGFRS